MSHGYLKGAAKARNMTPQSEPIPGRTDQVVNNAGGYVFKIDDWGVLRRFLILGAEGNTFYASEHKMVTDNVAVLDRCLAVDGPRTVREIVAISETGRAPKNDPAIFALAMAAGSTDEATRKAALAALPKVCRIGTHLFHFAEFVEKVRGWGRRLKAAFAEWYLGRSVQALRGQVVKYRQRDGWSHRDLLRLAHVKTTDPEKARVFDWVTHRGQTGAVVAEGKAPKKKAPVIVPEDGIIWAFEEAQKLDASKAGDRAKLITLITDHKLPWEALPTEALNVAEVQEALLPHMGLTAMVRNLGNYTRSGLIAPMSDAAKLVKTKLDDKDALRESKLHPLQILTALKTYAAGRGVRGSNTWTPVQSVVDALDRAFYNSFGNVTPTGKRIVIAVDVSGSMDGGEVGGVPGLTPRIASGALAMVPLQTEEDVVVIAFSSSGGSPWMQPGGRHRGLGAGAAGVSTAPVSKLMRLDAVCGTFKTLSVGMGGTDCALPMLWAQQAKIKADAFIVITDNETWAGPVHPTQALAQYRQQTGIAAKLVAIGMTATEYTVADPTDAGQMDVVGFDGSMLTTISDFIRDGFGTPSKPAV